LDVVKVVVDVDLKLSFNTRYFNIELNEISVKGVFVMFEEVVFLVLELFPAFIETIQDWLNTFKVMDGKSSELLDGSKEINEL